MNRLIHTVILAAAALALSPAVADGGAYEISPLCVATGCFGGDDPGFPVEIFQTGRYVLTGNLDVSNEANAENASGIVVFGSIDVSIDLNGFEIRGPVSCTGQPVTSCSTTEGTGIGVRLANNNASLRIKHGSITGMGQHGISCGGVGSSCQLDGLRLSQNRENGLRAGGLDAFVIRTAAVSNGVEGLNLRYGAVRDSRARFNGGDGIRAGEATIESATSTSNGGDGIVSNGVVQNSTASSNDGNGIFCFGCQALFNQVVINDGFGIDLGNSALFGGNRVSGNALGDTDGANFSTVLLPNHCADASC